MTKIGILHPGEMGVSVAASAINSGHEVFWASYNRSDKTRQRAEKYHLVEMASLTEFCRTCEIIISICPPHAAEDLADAVVGCGFKGSYLDANAISPQQAVKIGRRMESNGVQFTDGGIIGGPAWTSKETWLYLSGRNGATFADCFAKGPLETKIIGEEIGKASALKMCYAAYSKGTTALLAAILATAESFGVRDALDHQWEMDDGEFAEQARRRVARVTTKAWRFEGEMREIADTIKQAGLPNGFHKAAAEIYGRLAKFKDTPVISELDIVLNTLLQQTKRP